MVRQHSISNYSKTPQRKCRKNMLIFIEVQTGTYFGEDDIVRIGDDYGTETKNSDWDFYGFLNYKTQIISSGSYARFF